VGSYFFTEILPGASRTGLITALGARAWPALAAAARLATVRKWLTHALVVGLAAAGVFFALWISSQWASYGFIQFRTGDRLFCSRLTTDSVGVSCQGPAYRNSALVLPSSFYEMHTWPWTLVDHVERHRSSSLFGSPALVGAFFIVAGALISLAIVIVPLFMLRALVRFLRS
jgi:hypothetical protein